MASLKDFILSKVRIKILQIFLVDPKKIYYVRELVRLTGEEINAVRRELIRMDANGMVSKEKRGNRLYYNFNKTYLFFNDLANLVAKTTGLGRAIIKEKHRLGKIKYAILSGKFAQKIPREEGEVDLLIIGEVVIQELANLIKNIENKENCEINYSVMTKEEFYFRKKRLDPFINQILLSSRILLIGNELNAFN